MAKDFLSKLASKATLPLLDKIERKISGQGAIRAGKGLFQLILNEEMDDLLKS